jgi:CubicO group peptidase (beta-lactamase class C family)
LLKTKLEQGIRRHGVPGASMAVLRNGRVETAAAGVLNIDTGVAVTEDSVFQIGSVTKSLTATLVMMQVDAGRISLDDRIVDHLPDFALEDAAATGRVTVRQLLCHTSGIDGDRLDDTGSDPDAVRKLVGRLKDCRSLHAPGALFSYTNVGYIVLARILERLEQKPWDEILEERLIVPLGLESATTSGEVGARYSVASGHVDRKLDGTRVTVGGFAPRSNGPSGTTLAMTAADLLAFARFHIEGITRTGEPLLSRSSLDLMRQQHVATPLSVRYSGWGLGWMIFGFGGSEVVGHDGGWAGQTAYLRLDPRENVALALLVNGGFAAGVFRDVAAPLLHEWCGLTPPQFTPPDYDATRDVRAYAGRYGRFGQCIELASTRGRLVGTLTGPYVDDEPVPISVELLTRDQGCCRIGTHPEPVSCYFLQFGADGRPAYFHVTERAFRRIIDSPEPVA